MSITRAEWTAALRSGIYPQGAGRLYRAGRYCCLGVAAALSSDFIQQGPGQEEFLHVRTNYVHTASIPEGTFSDIYLPMVALDALAILNDGHSWTFNDIADWVDSLDPEGFILARPTATMSIVDQAVAWKKERKTDG